MSKRKTLFRKLRKKAKSLAKKKAKSLAKAVKRSVIKEAKSWKKTLKDFFYIEIKF
jgi:hypothetical protein